MVIFIVFRSFLPLTGNFLRDKYKDKFVIDENQVIPSLEKPISENRVLAAEDFSDQIIADVRNTVSSIKATTSVDITGSREENREEMKDTVIGSFPNSNSANT